MPSSAPAPSRPATTLDARYRKPLAEPLAAPAIKRTAKDATAVLRGRIIHALLQVLAPSQRPAAAAASPQGIAQLLQLPAAILPALHAECLAEAQSVLAAPALQRFFGLGQTAWNELPLHLAEPGGGVNVLVLDRLVDDGESLWIVDYKTRPSGSPEAVLAEAEPQLRRYAAAVARVFPGRAIRAGIIATASAEWRELPGAALGSAPP